MAESKSGENAVPATLVDPRLLKLLEVLVSNRDHAASPLGYDQLLVGLRFSALRNGLGRFGSHGEQDIALLPAPQLNSSGKLTIESLPPDAASVILFGAAGEQLLQIPVQKSGTVSIEDPDVVPSVAWVQANDRHGNPIRLGFPRLVDQVVEVSATGAPRRPAERANPRRAT